MNPFKSLLSRSTLALGLIFSMVSTNCVEATAEAKSWLELALDGNTETVTVVDLCYLISFAALISYFYFRKPPKEKRFDKKKLIKGTWKERFQNIAYFFTDKIIGWPYKAGKKIYRLKPGVKLKDLMGTWNYKKNLKKASWHYRERPQKPAGALGYFQAYVLYIPITLIWALIHDSESYTVIEQKKNKE